jgi:hypothetical protein
MRSDLKMPKSSATESFFGMIVALVMMYVLLPAIYRLYGLLGAGLLAVLTMLLLYGLGLQFWGALKRDHKTTKRTIVAFGHSIKILRRHFYSKKSARAHAKEARVNSKRVRCLYCGSPNPIKNAKCQRCFAPLPENGTVIY